MSELNMEKIIEEVMRLYLYKIKEKALMVNMGRITDNSLSLIYRQAFERCGLSVVDYKEYMLYERDLSKYNSVNHIIKNNVKSIYIEGITLQDCTNLLQGRASSDKLLWLMRIKDYLPTWICIEELINPFSNRKLENQRCIIFSLLNKKGYLTVGRGIENINFSLQNIKSKDEKQYKQTIRNKKFITLQDICIRGEGVLEIPHSSKTTLAVEDYCRYKCIKIRRV